jgi:hypothetical protein
MEGRRTLGRLMRVVPELGGDPDGLSREVGSLDAVSDLLLVHVDRRGVDVLVPTLESGEGGLLNLSGLGEPVEWEVIGISAAGHRI